MAWCEPSHTIIGLDFAYGYLKFVAAYFASLIVWGLYRHHYNLKFEAKESLPASGREALIGFRDCVIGTSLRYTYLGLILLSQMFLCVVVWNVVCATSAEVQPYWTARAKTYIIFYVSGLAMCLILHFLDPLFETFFYLRDSLDQCCYVQSNKRQGLFEVIKSVWGLAMQKEAPGIQSEADSPALPLLKVQKKADSTRFICHNQVTYTYLESESDFVCCDQSTVYELLGKEGLLRNGLSSEDVKNLSNLIGKNTIDLEVPGILQAFGKELLHPVNILRLGSLWQGIFLRFYIWSVLWAVMILFTTFKTLKVIILNQENIKKALENYIGRPISVLRDGVKTRIPSHELVPGDIMFLSQDLTAPYRPEPVLRDLDDQQELGLHGARAQQPGWLHPRLHHPGPPRSQLQGGPPRPVRGRPVCCPGRHAQAKAHTHGNKDHQLPLVRRLLEARDGNRLPNRHLLIIRPAALQDRALILQSEPALCVKCQVHQEPQDALVHHALVRDSCYTLPKPPARVEHWVVLLRRWDVHSAASSVGTHMHPVLAKQERGTAGEALLPLVYSPHGHPPGREAQGLVSRQNRHSHHQ
ncbi:hypothetical protein OIY81_3035 [Cryptosporidium canis]|uniref:Uncharacterized protein n=1 Tax=Cryptosporidium canis TaxID=195482 RepID=A0ABQ8P2U7_9CRYT|nr:hypothetical protein OJ252_3369 [Cryptosporidium canis]KAJ1607011.1 hypothetical protein OIY81_3035 [Cryptosporidium canis]